MTLGPTIVRKGCSGVQVDFDRTVESATIYREDFAIPMIKIDRADYLAAIKQSRAWGFPISFAEFPEIGEIRVYPVASDDHQIIVKYEPKAAA